MQVFEESGETERNHMGDGAADSQQYYRGNSQMAVPQTNGYTNGYTNGNTYTNGNSNGYVSHTANGYPKPAVDPSPLPSHNF
jgi:hypothetical protein